MQPNKEELRDWFEHPITAHFFEIIKNKREDLIEALSYRNLDSNQQQQLVGRIAGMTDVLNTSYEE